MKQARDMLRHIGPLRRQTLKSAVKQTIPEDTIGVSWELLANERKTRFTEMEYHLPPNVALETLADIIQLIEAKHSSVFYPIEVRKTAGDDMWLSPFQGGPRVSIAVHAHEADPNDWFFKDIEPIFRARGGRPHWGKLHSLGAYDLEAIYPDFGKFLALRETLDPDGRFVSANMAKLWNNDRVMKR